MEAQQDAVSLITTTRCESNPESTVGILSMAGKGVEVHVSPTQDLGKLLASFSSININGESDVAAAVQVAQLALKHRRNKNGRQRIIVFVASPVATDTRSLEKVGAQLKKNGVAVDVIMMGEGEGAANNEKMQRFVQAVNSGDNSHLITVPPGVMPSEALMSTPIFTDLFGGPVEPSGAGGGGAAGGAGGAGGMGRFAEYGGVDPNLDPELAMALMMSAQEAREADTHAPAAGDAPSSASTAAPASSSPASMEDDEEAMLQQALALSQMDFSSAPATDAPAAAPATTSSSSAMTDETDEEEAMRLAMAMSMEPTEAEQAQAAAGADSFLDPEFVSSLL